MRGLCPALHVCSGGLGLAPPSRACVRSLGLPWAPWVPGRLPAAPVPAAPAGAWHLPPLSATPLGLGTEPSPTPGRPGQCVCMGHLNQDPEAAWGAGRDGTEAGIRASPRRGPVPPVAGRGVGTPGGCCTPPSGCPGRGGRCPPAPGADATGHGAIGLRVVPAQRPGRLQHHAEKHGPWVTGGSWETPGTHWVLGPAGLAEDGWGRAAGAPPQGAEGWPHAGGLGLRPGESTPGSVEPAP